MALRDSVNFHNQHLVLERIMTKMGIKPAGRGGKAGNKPTTDGTLASRQICLCQSAGAPTSSNTSYAPTGLGDLCYDSTNNDVYRCTAFTDTSTFTWTKIVD